MIVVVLVLFFVLYSVKNENKLLETEKNEMSMLNVQLIKEKNQLLEEKSQLVTQKEALLQERDNLAGEKNVLTTNVSKLATEKKDVEKQAGQLEEEKSMLEQEYLALKGAVADTITKIDQFGQFCFCNFGIFFIGTIFDAL